MSGFRLTLRASFVASLTVGFLSAQPTHAQDACRFLSGAARAACNHVQDANRAARNKAAADAQRPAPDGGSVPAEAAPPQPDTISGPIAPPTPPAPGSQRYDIARGGLSVDVSGSYPQSYGPAWALNATQPQQITTNRYNLLNHGPQGTESLFVRITEDQGRPALEFSRRSTQPCLADIVGLPRVITSTPQRFALANFRYANNLGPQCQRSLGSSAPWKGSITLSANPNGDLAFSLLLDLAMPTGAPWFEFTAQDLPFPNKMTPQMAVADIEAKKQVALAAAAREKQAEDARAAAAVARAQAAARIAALPHAGPVYSRQMAEYVQADASGWAMNRLDSGSVGNVRIYSGSVKSGDFILRAEYTYNGGMQGWVVAQYSQGKFNCIQFWDSMIGCRRLRKAGEGQAMLTSIIVDGMSTSGGAPSKDCQKMDIRDSNGQPITGTGCAGQ